MVESEDDCFQEIIHTIARDDCLNDFLSAVESTIEDNNNKIKQICSQKYPEFIHVSYALLKIRDQSTSLMKEVSGINSQVQTMGNKLINVISESSESQFKQRFSCQVTNDLISILPALELLEKIKNYLSEGKYNETMKSLKEFEAHHTLVMSKFKFNENISNFVTDIRRQIKMEIKKDLNTYLEVVRYQSSRFGYDLIRSIQRHADCLSRRDGGKITLDAAITEFEDKMNNDSKTVLNLIPLHKCINVYQLLDSMDDFENYYINQRQQQILLAFDILNKKIANPKLDLLDETFFDDIAGFFMIEDRVANTVEFSEKSYLYDLWKLAEKELVLFIEAGLNNCLNSELLLVLKTSIIYFSNAMKKLDFVFSPLSSVVDSLFKQYVTILTSEIDKRVKAVYSKSGYTRLMLHCKSDYHKYFSRYPNLPKPPNSFPCELPLSEVVLTICEQLKEYVENLYDFFFYSMYSGINVDSNVRRAVNKLLYGFMHFQLLRNLEELAVDGHSVGEMTQIYVDMEYLIFYGGYLHDCISSLTLTDRRSEYVTVICNECDLSTKLIIAREKIQSYCSNRVNDIFNEYDFNWVKEEDEVVETSTKLDKTIICFLNEVINSLKLLQMGISHEIMIFLFETVFDCFKSLLTNQDIKMITYNSLLQFSANLNAVEEFSQNDLVPGLKSEIIVELFLPMRQSVDVLVNWDWNEYLGSQDKSDNNYRKAQSEMVILIVEKLLSADKKKLMFAFKKTDRDRRKMLENLLKQLKDIKK